MSNISKGLYMNNALSLNSVFVGISSHDVSAIDKKRIVKLKKDIKELTMTFNLLLSVGGKDSILSSLHNEIKHKRKLLESYK